MKKIVGLFFGLTFCLGLNAQEKSMRLSLEEAIQFAIENSYNTKASKNEVAAAKEVVWETTATGLPQVNASLDYKNYLKQPVSIADFNDDGINEEFVFGTKQNIYAVVSLSQLIFDGSYLVALQATKAFLKISKQVNEKTELVTREAVVNAYGAVLVAEKSMTILEGNLSILEKNLKDAKKIYQNGLNEEEDVEQLEITYGTLKNQLSNIQRMKGISYQMLNLTLGNAIDTTLILTDNLDALAEQSSNLGMIAETFKVSNHIDFKMAENERETKRLLVMLEKSKALPTLSAFLDYGSQAFSDSFTFFKRDQLWFNSSLLGVSLKVPIFSSFGRKSKTAQAKIALETASFRVEETEQRLNLLAQKAKSEYQLSLENYTTAKRNVALSERIENKQRIKFFEGISSSFDLLIAQNQLYTQQQNYVESMMDVIAKKAALENALNVPIK
jgi:outer membrane protein TolC